MGDWFTCLCWLLICCGQVMDAVAVCRFHIIVSKRCGLIVIICAVVPSAWCRSATC